MELKLAKLRKANFRAKRQNIQKAPKSFGDITKPTKQNKISPIQKIEPTAKPIEQTQKAGQQYQYSYQGQQNMNRSFQQGNTQQTPTRNRKPTHTTFFSNVPWNFSYESFGEISCIYSLIQTKGIAFDIRNA